MTPWGGHGRRVAARELGDLSELEREIDERRERLCGLRAEGLSESYQCSLADRVGTQSRYWLETTNGANEYGRASTSLLQI